ENSRSAVLKSPACRNAHPRSWISAARVLANAAGTAGCGKSGNLGAVTTGTGTIFGAQAPASRLTNTTGANSDFRIRKSLPRLVCGAALQRCEDRLAGLKALRHTVSGLLKPVLRVIEAAEQPS